MISNSTGRTGVNVSALGFGAGHIGSPDQTDREVQTLLNRLGELGITFIDTARGYGLSEERLGRLLTNRSHMVLCTKVGYGVDGVADWTYDCVVQGVERALRVLQTDYLDVVLLHSCPQDTLRRYEVVQGLLNVKARGLVRAIGYSGDNEDLEFAVSLGDLDIYEGSFNLFDQKKLNLLNRIRGEQKGFIAKRPLGNAPWRFAERPVGHYGETYWERMKVLGVLDHDPEPGKTALRFAAYSPGVSTAIAGTAQLKHLDQLCSWMEEGALPAERLQEILDAYQEKGASWRSEI